MVRPWEKGHGRGQRTSFLPEDHAGAQTALLWSRLCVWEGGGSVCQPFFHGSFPKKQKSLCPRRDTGRESAFGEGRGEFEGGREPPLCASQRGSLPPSTKSLLQSLTRYRGARSGSEATRSASAGRKGRSLAWAGVTQRSSWRSRAQGVPSKAVTWKKCSCTCRSRSA